MTEIKKKRIAIIGGGSSAATFLQMLLKKQEELEWPDVLPVQIEIFSENGQLGSGIAWDEARPFHKLNTYIKPAEVKAFKKLMTKHPEQFSGPPEDFEYNEVSRTKWGQHLKYYYQHAIQELKDCGIPVHLASTQCITDVVKDKDQFHVKSEHGKSGPFDYVVLATGHIQGKSDPGAHKGIFPSPWSAKNLEENIDPTQPVAIMGTSLSGIDAALTLAHKFGHFEHKADGSYKFIPNDTRFKLTMYSSHGVLPCVLGSVEIRGRELSLKQLKDKARDSQGFVSLDNLFDALKRDFLGDDQIFSVYHADSYFSFKDFLLKILPGTKRFKQPFPPKPNVNLGAIKKELEDSPRVEEAIARFQKWYDGKEPAQVLRTQIEQATASISGKIPLDSQEYLRRIMGDVDACQTEFSAEDKDRFLREVRPLFAKLSCGMVMTNAKSILALMEAGCLEVKKLGKNSSVTPLDDRPGAQICYQNETGEHSDYYSAIVRATGDDPQQMRHSSPLMKNLFASGLAQELLVPFANPKEGKRRYEESMADSKNMKNIRKIGDKCYLAPGGLSLNNETFELAPSVPTIGASKNAGSGIFALGIPAMMQYPLLQGLIPAEKTSSKIVEKIYADYLETILPGSKHRDALHGRLFPRNRSEGRA